MKVLVYCLLFFSSQVMAQVNINGLVSVESRTYTENPAEQGQLDQQFSFVIEPEFYMDWNDGADSLIIKPFIRFDSEDNKRSHFDIREFNWLHLTDNWEFKAGIGKVFWGVTESQHLVDVINQVDEVEAPDGEVKLGQLMLNLRFFSEWGTFSGFILPQFRERTLPGLKGRLRAPSIVDTEVVLYESTDKENHLDFSLRWSHSVADFDFGLHYFNGTNRDPKIVLNPNTLFTDYAIYYNQMKQVGLDLQATIDGVLYKIEAIHRREAENFTAYTAGFEYTFFGIVDERHDVSFLLEYLYDSRGKLSSSANQNDVFLGCRWLLNDTDSTEILIGVTQDLDIRGHRFSRVEASSRLTNSVTWRLTAAFFSAKEEIDPAYLFRQDDYIQFNIDYYF